MWLVLSFFLRGAIEEPLIFLFEADGSVLCRAEEDPWAGTNDDLITAGTPLSDFVKIHQGISLKSESKTNLSDLLQWIGLATVAGM